MSQRGLEALLRPKSIAVIGASMKPQRAGYLMMRNLLAGGFNGPVLPVTPAWKAVQGVLAWPTIDSLPFTPDLAVLCTNARRNLELLEALGQKGCKTCILLAAGAVSGAARACRPLSDAAAGPKQSRAAGALARAECQLFAGADSPGQAGVYLPVRGGVEYYS